MEKIGDILAMIPEAGVSSRQYQEFLNRGTERYGPLSNLVISFYISIQIQH